MTDVEGEVPIFLEKYIDQSPEIPQLPEAFSIVVANPADMGTRGGIIIDQLHQYDQLVTLI